MDLTAIQNPRPEPNPSSSDLNDGTIIRSRVTRQSIDRDQVAQTTEREQLERQVRSNTSCAGVSSLMSHASALNTGLMINNAAGSFVDGNRAAGAAYLADAVGSLVIATCFGALAANRYEKVGAATARLQARREAEVEMGGRAAGV